MKGLLETILRDRYGAPTFVRSTPFPECRWNNETEARRCILYKESDSDDESGRFPILHPIYGDAIGGFLVGDSLKLSMIVGPKVFGLYRIEELQDRPEVRYANSVDPNICFFMDAANVWFYGIKHDELYVYDAPMDELDSLGPARLELEKLLDKWEETT